jgi:F0F1-type ATP synthase membrane subunit b/b'
MNNNSHENMILAVILLIALVVVGWTVYPAIAKAFERANKVITDPAGQTARL